MTIGTPTVTAQAASSVGVPSHAGSTPPCGPASTSPTENDGAATSGVANTQASAAPIQGFSARVPSALASSASRRKDRSL